jgi:iron(III) transport system substrate-binding protein
MTTSVRVLAAVVLIAAMTGCSPGAPTTPTSDAATSARDYLSDDPAWLDLVHAAQREGTVNLGATVVGREDLPVAFKQRFGVELVMDLTDATQFPAKLQSERAAGLYTEDAVVLGSPFTLPWYKAGWLDPIRPALMLPEVTDAAKWHDDRLPFLDPEDQYVVQMFRFLSGIISVNTQVVQDGEIHTWDDLLNPKWQGKIVLEDPTVTGRGQGNAVYLYRWKGEDWWKRLYIDQQPVFTSDFHQAGDWVARGTYPVTNMLTPAQQQPMVQQGLPIKPLGLLDGQGWILSGGATLVMLNHAPHPNAAKLLVNWLMSREGQELWGKDDLNIPRRRDITPSWTWDFTVPKDGVTYGYDSDIFEVQTVEVPPIVRRMRQLLGK